MSPATPARARFPPDLEPGVVVACRDKAGLEHSWLVVALWEGGPDKEALVELRPLTSEPGLSIAGEGDAPPVEHRTVFVPVPILTSQTSLVP